MDNKKLILSYGFDFGEMSKIQKIAKEVNLSSVKTVKNTMGKMTVNDIINGNLFEVYDCSMPKVKVILLNNFSDYELEKAISMFKSAFSEIPILAVVTESSINWTFEKLVNHLEEERQWHRMQNR
ncbi:MAG: DUF3783 domain-containing protein [Solirubrobacterales bacterium]